MFIILDIKSKNRQELSNFIKFYLSNKMLNRLTNSVTYQQKPVKKKIITVLKSPHVNKTAQETFEFKYHRKMLKIFSSRPALFLIILKKIKETFFSELDLKIHFVFNRKIEKNKLKHTFNINLYYLENNKIKFIDYLKRLEVFGEIGLKEFLISLDSSVG